MENKSGGIYPRSLLRIKCPTPVVLYIIYTEIGHFHFYKIKSSKLEYSFI